MEHFEGCTFKPEIPEGCDLKRDRILLHCCCGPCSTAILEWMVNEGLRPGLFFSNSNIVPFDEYVKRRDELARYAATFGLEVADDEYDHDAWLEFVKSRCVPTTATLGTLRGGTGAERSEASGGVEQSETSLGGIPSPDKANEPRLVWWPQNWRKGGLQERRNFLIKSCALYNQTWCGCEFSQKTI